MAKRKKADEAATDPTTTETASAAADTAVAVAEAEPAPAPRERRGTPQNPDALSYDEAMQRRREGTLGRSVLTEQGWVTP